MKVVSLLVLLVCVTVLYSETEGKEYPIKTFVTLMLENRSFDMLLGTLKEINPEINGLTGNMTNPTGTPGQVCTVAANQQPYETPNAGHSYGSTICEQYGTKDVQPPYPSPPMDGFVSCQSYGCRVMNAIPMSGIPVSKAFVENFALFDEWFSGFPGPTEVNRAFYHSTSSAGYCDNPDDIVYVLGFPQESLLHSLEVSNVTTKVYMADDVSTTLFFRDQRNVKSLERYHTFEQFLRDAADGNLAQYNLIEPRYFSIPGFPANDEHPQLHGIPAGEAFFKTIYDALRSSPQWDELALFITYDEHGGLYDHVPSPVNATPPKPGMKCISGGDQWYDFTRLGVRVPAFLISPWVPKGAVYHGPDSAEYCHSSMAKTVHDIFMPNAPFLTDRHQWAASFANMFLELSAPRTDTPLTMPNPPPLNSKQQFIQDTEWQQPLNDFQWGLVKGYAALTGAAVPTHLKTELEATHFMKSQFALLKKMLEEKIY